MDVLRLMPRLYVATLMSLTLAVAAILLDRPVNETTPPRLLLADYAAQIERAAQLTMTHGKGISGTSEIVVTQKDGQWVLPQRGDYPANQELVTETLLALADVKALEARTAKPEWHRALGLVVPEDLGNAVRFKVSDDNGAPLAALLLGREQQSEAEAKQQVKTYAPAMRQFYARLEASPQSWLARGRLPRNASLAAWMDASLPKHDLAQLKRVAFSGRGRAFSLLRVTPESWSMAGGDKWLDGFLDLRPDDVAQRETIAFDTAQRMQLVYTDGLRVVYDNVGAATVIWMGISASADETANAEVKALAAQINEKYGAWALRFDAARAPVLLPSPEMLRDAP